MSAARDRSLVAGTGCQRHLDADTEVTFRLTEPALEDCLAVADDPHIFQSLGIELNQRSLLQAADIAQQHRWPLSDGDNVDLGPAHIHLEVAAPVRIEIEGALFGRRRRKIARPFNPPGRESNSNNPIGITRPHLDGDKLPPVLTEQRRIEYRLDALEHAFKQDEGCEARLELLHHGGRKPTGNGLLECG